MVVFAAQLHFVIVSFTVFGKGKKIQLSSTYETTGYSGQHLLDQGLQVTGGEVEIPEVHRWPT
jgi:hypothetical protein